MYQYMISIKNRCPCGPGTITPLYNLPLTAVIIFSGTPAETRIFLNMYRRTESHTLYVGRQGTLTAQSYALGPVLLQSAYHEYDSTFTVTR